MLEQLNYRIIAVDSADGAFTVLRSGQPVDLVFTDVMLPGDLDGVALAQAIRSRHPSLPILLTSGYAKALGAQHGLPILRKPYQLATLSQAVRDNLDGHRKTG
jgi:CheY-like chemotaxis protein